MTNIYINFNVESSRNRGLKMKQEDDNTVDKFTFSIPHKWGKYIGILLADESL
jgi:hypothetical protein